MRVKTSLIPFNRRFYQEYSKSPDLYGPFWIMSTLVIVLTIMHNLSTYLELPEENKDLFAYDFRVLPISVTVLFAASIGLPFAIQMAVKCFGSAEVSIPLLHGVGIYCYSYSSFLITSVLCGFFPHPWL